MISHHDQFLLVLKVIKKFFQKITIIDGTLECFELEAAYMTDFHANLRIVSAWLLATSTIFCSDLLLAYNSLESLSHALAITIMFDLPLIINSVIEINFVAKIK